jgi:excisionase family DNA binding protein
MELLTAKQTAKYLGISPRTLESMRLKGVGPTYVRVGRLVRYQKAAVEDWVHSNQWNSTSDEKERGVMPARRNSGAEEALPAPANRFVIDNQVEGISNIRRTYPAHMPDLTRCGICHREVGSHDINIAGFGPDGQPRSVGHCCIDQLESALLIGIPRDTPELAFSRVIQYLESRQVDTERVKRVHSEGRLPYALHVFSRDLFRK